jgi:hypothetical protein
VGSVSTIVATIIAAFIGSFYNDTVTPIIIAFAVLMLPIMYIAWSDKVTS